MDGLCDYIHTIHRIEINISELESPCQDLKDLNISENRKERKVLQVRLGCPE